MKNIKNLGKAVDSKRQKGASMVEYALLVALIAVIAIASVRFLGENISTQFSRIGSEVGAA